MSKLYVGKIVHYQSYGTPNGEYMPEARAAIVTQLLSDNAVGLCVLNPTGLFLNPTIQFSETPKAGHWNFIPEEEATSTSTVEQLTPVLPDPNAAPTLDTTTFPDEDAEYNESTEQVGPTTPDSSEEEICGVQKYVGPSALPSENRGDYCIKTKGHEGDHESWSGLTWPNFY